MPFDAIAAGGEGRCRGDDARRAAELARGRWSFLIMADGSSTPRLLRSAAHVVEAAGDLCEISVDGGIDAGAMS